MSPAIPPDSVGAVKTSTTLAMVSLVLGIVGLPTGGGLIVLGLVGMALGGFALRKARTSLATHGGRRHALAGVALNFIAIECLPGYSKED